MLWELSTIEWVTSFGFVCCISYISGWLAEGLMKSASFGHIGNWLLILMGCYTAMYVFNSVGYDFEYDPLFTLAYVTAGAACFFLFMCITKRIFIR